jgi:hypothetical protein
MSTAILVMAAEVSRRQLLLRTIDDRDGMIADP